uniref:molybdopterin-dependent oxidoreductase n=1 Tax=uncultured Halomonas sp. TaxID=173971 RepID=UPI00260B77ED|nr:molybdopterin-dependent oxidoreductase [uncultured Halomonas sp.]
MPIRYRLLMTTLMLSPLLLSPLIAWAADSRLPPPEGDAVLVVAGDIGLTNHGDAAYLDARMLATLPRERLTTHTSVTHGPQAFEGVLARDLLEAVKADGETVTALALNDYRVEIPAVDFYDYDVLLADTMNGERLSRRGKGPLWIVYPRDAHAELQDIRYDYRWVWQLYRLEVE